MKHVIKQLSCPTYKRFSFGIFISAWCFSNKQPIGKTDQQTPYTTHKVELNQGDTIYIFSDGYADQFGGEKGKKLKSANFKKLLLDVVTQDMQTQLTQIDEAFENWKGDLEQLDDVCVIGVRV